MHHPPITNDYDFEFNTIHFSFFLFVQLNLHRKLVFLVILKHTLPLITSFLSRVNHPSFPPPKISKFKLCQFTYRRLHLWNKCSVIYFPTLDFYHFRYPSKIFNFGYYSFFFSSAILFY